MIASRNEEEHKKHIEEVFKRLRKHGLAINLAKCVFGEKEVKYLGYTVNRAGIKPLKERVEIIENYPKPKNISELRRFLGVVNFYRRFIRNAAKEQGELHKYLIGAKKKDKRIIKWTKEAEEAFDNCKKQIANATELAHPRKKVNLELHIDASDVAMGAVLHQVYQKKLEPLAFYSKKFSKAEQNYSTYDREN